jgi:hypothetical protein
MQDAERAAQEALEQKATQQTLGGEGGELDAAAVDEVPPVNRHLPRVYRDEPPVGEGGPTVLSVEILDEPCRSPAVEDLREHMHGQEEVAADGHPAGVRSVLFYLYMLRVQIFGFMMLWPISGWAFQTPLVRGLTDLRSFQVMLVSVFAALQAIFLIITTNLVIVWGRVRLERGREPVCHSPAATLRIRQIVSITGIVFWAAFMRGVRTRSHTDWFWLLALVGFGGAASFFLILEPLLNRLACQGKSYRFFLFPLRPLWTDPSGRASASDLKSYDRRLVRWMSVLGPGYCDYDATGSPHRVLPGHLLALAWVMVILFYFEFYGLAWLLRDSSFPGKSLLSLDDTVAQMSTLSMALSGSLVAICVLSALAFFTDRYRIPLCTVLLTLVTLSSWVGGRDTFFWSEPMSSEQFDHALTPGEVMQASPQKFIVVAAGGGGIQASGWTAQVLAGLREDREQGAAFTQSLKVISGVSGGASGAAFYLGTYDGVWGKAYSAAEARERAMASSLPAVAWGLVYPDLHQMLFPIPIWGDRDRGWALERSFAQTAGYYPGPKLLDLAPLVRSGLPVMLVNATLSSQALPVVFSNGRFPDPDASEAHRRGIRGFHTDLRLETRLETAVRLSASFPLVSPAARPSQLKGKDAFLDGGYFDNSGLYSLMGWLEQAAERLPAGEAPREVLLLQIDAFPEPQGVGTVPVAMAWYRQLTIPLETVVGVRETGQAARTKYEFPLLMKNLEGRMHVRPVEFRYRPSLRCALEPPPLSWHLNELEKECIREGWHERRTQAARDEVRRWLAAP